MESTPHGLSLPPSATARTATAKKSAGASFFAVFIVLMMIFNCGNLSYRSLSNMQKTLGETEVYKQVKRGWLSVNTAPVTETTSSRLSQTPTWRGDRGPHRRQRGRGSRPDFCPATSSSNSPANTSGTLAI